MISRNYNKIIEIYETQNVSDGFGGYNTTDVLLSKSWCNLKTFNAGSKNTNAVEFGVLDISNSILITLRKRNDLDYSSKTNFIKYRGEKYVIATSPVNVDFNDTVIQFIATKVSDNSENTSADN